MKDKASVFIDTNILVYSFYGTSGQKEKVASLLQNQPGLPIISTQILKEFSNTSLKKKLVRTTQELKLHLTRIIRSFNVAEISSDTIFDALDLKEPYHYSFYDSLILATALENKCAALYSEDLQHDQIISRKLKIINPFK